MCLKIIALRISGYINYTLGFLLGPSKCLYVFFLIFVLLVFLCGCISFGPLHPHWSPYPRPMSSRKTSRITELEGHLGETKRDLGRGDKEEVV